MPWSLPNTDWHLYEIDRVEMITDGIICTDCNECPVDFNFRLSTQPAFWNQKTFMEESMTTKYVLDGLTGLYKLVLEFN